MSSFSIRSFIAGAALASGLVVGGLVFAHSDGNGSNDGMMGDGGMMGMMSQMQAMMGKCNAMMDRMGEHMDGEGDGMQRPQTPSQSGN